VINKGSTLILKYKNHIQQIAPKTKLEAKSSKVAKFAVPDRLCNLAGRYDNPMLELTLSPQSGI